MRKNRKQRTQEKHFKSHFQMATKARSKVQQAKSQNKKNDVEEEFDDVIEMKVT